MKCSKAPVVRRMQTSASVRSDSADNDCVTHYQQNINFLRPLLADITKKNLTQCVSELACAASQSVSYRKATQSPMQMKNLKTADKNMAGTWEFPTVALVRGEAFYQG